MDTISIEASSKSYPVFIGRGIITQLKQMLNSSFKGLTKIMIITDETVAEIHLHALISQLEDFHYTVFIVPSGEKAKTFEVYYSALTAALEAKLDRKSLVLAFGGGAVGDLGGFVAATFMRGISFIQIPTTILAHDSAVGGKVAINHPLGKNMIGAFYQPEAVFYDLEFLDSLPITEKRSGYAEVIKHALIQDQDFYQWLLFNVSDLEAATNDQLALALKKGIKIKGNIVAQDEMENGIRAFLNFGHTLGHAIEAEMGYGKITHGEAVMIGMVFALQLSIDLAGLSFNLKEFLNWIHRLGYKTEVPSHLKAESLIEKMEQDKKTIGSSINFVLLEQLGKPIMKQIDKAILLEYLT